MKRNKLIVRVLTAFFLIFSGISQIAAQHHDEDTSHSNANVATAPHDEEKKFDVLHHVQDSYTFHVINDFHIWLPVIVFEPGSGFDIFSSSELYHPDEETHLIRNKYYFSHGSLFIPELKDGHVQYDSTGHVIGKHAAKLTDIGSPHAFYSFSITKNVFGLLLSVALLFLIFFSVARKYKTRGTNVAPKGLQNAMESLVLFVKNDIAIPFIGEKKHARFLPYLLTIFFFIWINNLLGLIPIFPGGANVSGNIAFTFVLATLSLLLVFIFGRKHFWGHILWYPGVAVPLKIFLAVLEIVSIFSKPFALMIRLFANITAGHILIMSIIGMSFMAGSLTGVIGIGAITSTFSALMFVLELLVGAIQAYIFTLLTAQMIGAAVEDGHEHEEHAAEHAH